MQTVEGKEARSIVASELTAMVDLKVLPDMLSHYTTDPIEFEQLCRKFAVHIGLPENDYVRIYYPFFFSPDWDPRHGMFREQLCSMRVPFAEWERMKDTWVREDFPQLWPPRAAKRQCTGQQQQQQPAQQCELQVQPTAEERQAATEQVKLAIAAWSAERGINYIDWRRWHAARTDARLRTLRPEQYNPLVKVTPDINSPVEHCVRTIKHHVRELLLDSDLHDSALWKGLFYRELAEKAVQTHLTGAQGRHHVSGSVRKLPCILQILAADKGEPLVLEHVFGTNVGEPVRQPGPQDRYNVKGTGGEWIRDTRWT